MDPGTAEARGVRETHSRQTRQSFDSCPGRFGSSLDEIKGDRERIVVGSRHRTVHLGLTGAERSPRKDPVNRSSICEERVRCRSNVLIPKSVLKLCTADRARNGPGRSIQVEVSGEQNRRTCIILAAIFQGFINLRTAQSVITFAFKMQVIGDDGFPHDVGFRDQRQASPDSLLKRIDFGKKPVRAPETRLPLESKDTGI